MAYYYYKKMSIEELRNLVQYLQRQKTTLQLERDHCYSLSKRKNLTREVQSLSAKIKRARLTLGKKKAEGCPAFKKIEKFRWFRDVYECLLSPFIFKSYRHQDQLYLKVCSGCILSREEIELKLIVNKLGK